MSLALRQYSIPYIAFIALAVTPFSASVAGVDAKSAVSDTSEEKNGCDTYNENEAALKAHSKLMMKRHDEQDAIRLDMLKREEKLLQQREEEAKDRKKRQDESDLRVSDAQTRLTELRKRTDAQMDILDANEKRYAKILDRWEAQQDEYQKYLDSLPTSHKAFH